MRKPLYILDSRSLKRGVEAQGKLAYVVPVPLPFVIASKGTKNGLPLSG